VHYGHVHPRPHGERRPVHRRRLPPPLSLSLSRRRQPKQQQQQQLVG
jgi:hypothetical protein